MQVSLGIRATNHSTLVTLLIVARENKLWATVDCIAQEFQRRQGHGPR